MFQIDRKGSFVYISSC